MSVEENCAEDSLATAAELAAIRSSKHSDASHLMWYPD
jgi:hypothetical protein